MRGGRGQDGDKDEDEEEEEEEEEKRGRGIKGNYDNSSRHVYDNELDMFCKASPCAAVTGMGT